MQQLLIPWFTVSFLLCAVPASFAVLRTACNDETEIVAGLPLTKYPRDRQQVSVDFRVNDVRTKDRGRRGRVDGDLVLTWHDSTLSFEHRKPCVDEVSIADRIDDVWTPPLSFSNGEHIVYHDHSRFGTVKRNGTVTITQRVEMTVKCAVECEVRLRAERLPLATYDWLDTTANASRSYRLDRSKRATGDGAEELQFSFLPFEWNSMSIYRIFFPAALFMLISWMSLLLGPMAITRCILCMGSLVLLSLHYSSLGQTLNLYASNNEDFEELRLFSYLFVLLVLFELVFVSCMASLGRWTLCDRSSKKGAYSLESDYEELNDLRHRRSRRTCGCCRVTALMMDFLTFVALAALFCFFVYQMHERRGFIFKLTRTYLKL